MIKKQIINGKVFIEQTTYYVYEDETNHLSDIPILITSSEDEFNIHIENQLKKLVHIKKTCDTCKFENFYFTEKPCFDCRIIDGFYSDWAEKFSNI